MNKLKTVGVSIEMLLIVLTFVLYSISIASASQWVKTYGGAVREYAHSIQQTLDGGYIVAGSTDSFGAGSSDAWVLKLDDNGNVQWQKTYGGPGYDYVNSIEQTLDGGYIVTVFTDSFGAGSSDAWVLKLDDNGNVQWQKTYGGAGYDYANSIQQTLDGGYIVAGSSKSFENACIWEFRDLWILKLDGNGNVQWQKSYGFTCGKNDAYSVQQTSDGGFIVAGETYYSDTNVLVLKLDGNGNVQWQKSYGSTSHEHAYSIQQTLDGGYIVVGSTNSFGAAGSDAWVLKLDGSGNVQWQKTYGGPLDEYANSIQQTLDGGYIMTGNTNSFGAGNSDTWVLKLDGSGNMQWQKTYGGSNLDSAYSIQQTLDGGFIVAGGTGAGAFGDNGDENVWVLKLDG
ncbi:MAG: hypothetical protein A2Y81_06685, partial [Nitrospirae bacterium RBG_13_43_8]